MMLARATQLLLRHRYLAVAVAFLSPLTPLIGQMLGVNAFILYILAFTLGSVGILLATIITLHDGEKTGLLYTLAATVPYAIIYAVSKTQQQDGLALALSFGGAVLINLLTYGWAVMLRYGARWSQLLQIASLGGVLVISILHLSYPQLPEWWANMMQTSVSNAIAHDALLKGEQLTEMQAHAADFINASKYMVTGFLVTFILLASFMQLLVAHWWQYKLFKFGSRPRELRKLRLNHLTGILFIAACILFAMGNTVVLDMMPVLSLLFLAAGLSVIHFGASQMPASSAWFLLAAIYLVAPLCFPAAFVWVIASIAFCDIWFDIRRQLVKI